MVGICLALAWSRSCRLHSGRGAQEQPDQQPAPRRGPGDVTVTSCLGLMGGSGSNAAGYSCNGHLHPPRQPLHREPARAPRSAKSGTTVPAVPWCRAIRPSCPRSALCGTSTRRRACSCFPASCSLCCCSCWRSSRSVTDDPVRGRTCGRRRDVLALRGAQVRAWPSRAAWPSRWGACSACSAGAARHRPRAADWRRAAVRRPIAAPGAPAGQLQFRLQPPGPDQVPGAAQEEGNPKPQYSG